MSNTGALHHPWCVLVKELSSRMEVLNLILEKVFHVDVRILQEVLHAFQDKVTRDWDHDFFQLLDGGVLLNIVKFSHVVQLVDYELFNVSFVDFWAALEAEDTVFDCPDLILSSFAVCKGGSSWGKLRHRI